MDYTDVIGYVLLAVGLVAGIWLWIIAASLIASWL